VAGWSFHGLSQKAVTWRDREGKEQTTSKNDRVFVRGVYVWGVKSTVTKHSDYLFQITCLRLLVLFERTRQRAWLDAMTTPVDKERVKLCVLKHFFFKGSSGTKRIVKKLGIAHSIAILISCFQKFQNVSAAARSWRRNKNPKKLHVSLCVVFNNN